MRDFIGVLCGWAGRAPDASDKFNELPRPVMVAGVALMGVAGQHVAVDYSVMLAVDSGSPHNLVGVAETAVYVLKA